MSPPSTRAGGNAVPGEAPERTDGGIRTPDTRLRRPLLFPLSYVGMERKTGIEPAAFALARRRSATELLPHLRLWDVE